MKVGAQLFTLHDYCKTLSDFENTLARVADMGFTAVQVSGTCDYEAEWLRDVLRKYGLVCPLTHYKYDRIVDETEKTIAAHKTFGAPYIGLGSLPGIFSGNADEIPKYVAEFIAKAKPAAQKMRDAGELFMYHNHGAEYSTKINGKTVMECLSEAFAPDEMGFTLDTYWVKFGGYDPVAELKRLSGRIPCVHFKDMKVEEDGTTHFTWCGDGILNFEEIGEVLRGTGTEYAFIEQDQTFPDSPDPFDCLKKSRDYLKSIGFAF